MTDYEEIRIRLASDIKRIPNNPQTMSVLIKVANAHYDETLTVMREEMEKQ